MDQMQTPDNNKTDVNVREITTTDMNRFLAKMYGIMALAVFVSAIVAFIGPITYMEPLFAFFEVHYIATTVLFIAVPIILVIAIRLTAGANPTLSFTLLMLLAIMYGVELSSIFIVFTGHTIVLAFFCSSTIFIAMAILGLTTKKDLSNLGSYAIAALIGLIVATIVNLWVNSELFDLIMSYVGVVIFTILAAVDSQQAKEMYKVAVNGPSEVPSSIEDGDEKQENPNAKYALGENVSKKQAANIIAIMGALELYLDFLNIFLYLLKIFGSDRN